jgi:hypothetical protein
VWLNPATELQAFLPGPPLSGATGNSIAYAIAFCPAVMLRHSFRSATKARSSPSVYGDSFPGRVDHRDRPCAELLTGRDGAHQFGVRMSLYAHIGA